MSEHATCEIDLTPCPDHPDALIRRTWDQNHYVLNGEASGTGWRTNIRYECAECGRELEPLEVDSE